MLCHLVCWKCCCSLRARAQEAAGDLYRALLCEQPHAFFCSLVTRFFKLQEHSVPEHQLDELDRPGKNQLVCRGGGFGVEATAAFVSLVGALLAEAKTFWCLFLPGSWSSASTDWSLCGWYRWALITAQWEQPSITLLRLNPVATQYSKRNTTAAICLRKELRPRGRRLQLWHSFIFHLPSAFPQVTVALISFLETMLITYLSYKVGKWSTRPHLFFLYSIHCTFSFPSDTLIYFTPVAKRIPASVHQRTPVGSAFCFFVPGSYREYMNILNPKNNAYFK